MDIFEEVKETICQQLKAKPEDITLETSFIDDLGADSLDSIELVVELEEKFGIEIPDEDAQEMHTVGDVVNYIGKKISRHG